MLDLVNNILYRCPHKKLYFFDNKELLNYCPYCFDVDKNYEIKHHKAFKVLTGKPIEKEYTMVFKCKLCNLYGCKHNNPKLEKTTISAASSPSSSGNGDALVEKINNIISSSASNQNNPPIEGTKIRVIENTDEIPSSVKNYSDDCIKCNLCQNFIVVDYFDAHMKFHIQKAESFTGARTSDYRASSTAIVPAKNDQANPISVIVPKEKKPPVPDTRTIEPYKFREIENVSFAGTRTSDGRYSDITVTLWLKGRPTSYSSHYSGYASSSVSSDPTERFIIHLVYDSLEDWYYLNMEILKRSSYSSFDDKTPVPEQLCWQHEIFEKIKYGMLFFQIAPTSALKKIIKAFKTQEVLLEEEDGQVWLCQSKNDNELFEAMKKKSTSTTSYGAYGGYHGGHYGGMD